MFSAARQFKEHSEVEGQFWTALFKSSAVMSTGRLVQSSPSRILHIISVSLEKSVQLLELRASSTDSYSGEH